MFLIAVAVRIAATAEIPAMYWLGLSGATSLADSFTLLKCSTSSEPSMSVSVYVGGGGGGGRRGSLCVEVCVLGCVCDGVCVGV